MSSPTLGLIVPVYTEPAYLAALLSALVEQLKDLNEVVFIDDANREPIPSMLSDFAKIDSEKITIITNDTPKGISGSTSLGVSRISTDYVAFVDSDDLLEKNAFSIVISHILANPGVAVLSSKFSFLLSTGQVVERNRDDSGIDWRVQIASDNFISHLKVVSKEFLDRMHWTAESDGVQDAILNFCLDSNDSVVLIKDSLYLHRVHAQQHSSGLSSSAARALNISRRNWLSRNTSKRFLLSHHADFFTLPASLSNFFPGKLWNWLTKPSVYVMSKGGSNKFKAWRGKLERFDTKSNQYLLVRFRADVESFTKGLALLSVNPPASLGLYVPNGDPTSFHLAKVFSGLFDYILVDDEVARAMLLGDVPDVIPIIERTNS